MPPCATWNAGRWDIVSRMRIPPQSAAFVLLLGAMSAMPPFATDLGLPALGTIAGSLHTSAGMSGLTISLFMAGFTATPLIYGPVSDRYGRKPVLVGGLSAFAVASLLCALAPSIATLLIARLLEGAGAGAGITMAFAIVRDLFSGAPARTRLSMVTVVLNTAPVISPTVGALILTFAGWRAIYGTLAAIGFLVVFASLFGYRESRDRQTIGPRGSLVAGYRRLLGNRSCVGHFLIYGLSFGSAFAYISGSSLVVITLYRASPTEYGLLFACTALGIVFGATLNGWLSTRRTHRLPMLPTGLAGMIAVTVLLTLLALSGPVRLPVLVPLFFLVTFSFGIIAPNASHGTLEPIPEIAGVASGVLASFQMLCATVASTLVSLLFARFGLSAVVGTMLIFAIAAGLAYLAVPRAALSAA
ncbi:multidrug effflux MFS transporter [Acidisoma sp.]|uniref:multidrug effflux MFS transporter n=1 Tax=Acidisoma sp. TaxID=1872115 RepID=UPI003AFFA839